MFKEFKSTFQQNVALLLVGHTTLFTTDVDPQKMWDTYIGTYPEEIRQMSNCNCCRQFIKHYGNVVTIVNNKVKSIWDFAAAGHYGDIVKAMNELVTSAKVKDVFVHKFQKLGSDTSIQRLEDGTTTRWDHLFVLLPKTFVEQRNLSEESIQGSLRDSKSVFRRSLDELTIDATETMLELISQNSLYRGAESKGVLETFLKFQKQYAKLPEDEHDNFAWVNGTTTNNQAVARIRNTSAGTFLIDVSEGVDLNIAVAKFEKVMAPANYKRPTPVISARMIAEAEKTLTELGLVSALSRRFATCDDITVNNVLYVNRDKKASGIFAELKEDIQVNLKTFEKTETVTLKDFIAKILPTSSALEILLENKHEQKLMSLIAPSEEGPGMFKWNNNFSWSYNNAVADSMRDKVVAAGGRVDGYLRFTHSWNELDRNQSLMDLHVFMPGCSLPNQHSGGPQVRGRRVGWNARHDPMSGGVQDVDYTEAAPSGYIPIENITFPSLNRLPEGKYYFKIHNWSHRVTGGKGKAEIQIGDDVYQYVYPATKNHEWVDVAEATLKDGKFTIEHKIQPGETSSKEVWGMKTNKFTKVNMVLRSPNFWDGQGIGNEHVFFVLDGADNTGSVRGFFNEFLKEDLMQHKKVFEALAGKMKVEYSKNQLSGLGFSLTSSGEFAVKVTGKFTRTIKVTV